MKRIANKIPQVNTDQPKHTVEMKMPNNNADSAAILGIINDFNQLLDIINDFSTKTFQHLNLSVAVVLGIINDFNN
jgi:hypothetical protein